MHHDGFSDCQLDREILLDCHIEAYFSVACSVNDPESTIRYLFFNRIA